MKYKMILLLLFLALLGCSNNEVINEEHKVEFETILLSDNTVQVTKYIGTENMVIVPEQINGKTVTEIWDNAFANLSIEEITFPASIRRVGVNIFMNTPKLKRITLLGDEPFYLESFALDARQIDPSTGYLEIITSTKFTTVLIQFRDNLSVDPTSNISIEMEEKYGGTWLSYIDLIKIAD